MSAQQALAWAQAQVGTVEHPAGSNAGPGITTWERASGYGFPVPWCQCFANAAAVNGGAPQLRDGFTPTVLNGSHADQGFRRISLDDADPGDFVFFKWPGVSNFSCDHVGVLIAKTAATVTCVEGNTSSSNAGSQNNGGGVFIRTRSRSLSPGAVSVPYPAGSSDAFRTLNQGDQGSDVRAFQIATNKRASGCGRPDRTVTVDGDFGPETEVNGAWAAFVLGIGDSQAEIRSGGITAYVQNLVRNPDERNDTQKERAVARREVACK
jgi:hypothetical protein